MRSNGRSDGRSDGRWDLMGDRLGDRVRDLTRDHASGVPLGESYTHQNAVNRGDFSRFLRASSDSEATSCRVNLKMSYASPNLSSRWLMVAPKEVQLAGHGSKRSQHTSRAKAIILVFNYSGLQLLVFDYSGLRSSWSSIILVFNYSGLRLFWSSIIGLRSFRSS